MKRITLSVLMVFVLVLASCGGQGDETVTDDTESNVVTEQEVEEIEDYGESEPEVEKSPLEGRWTDEAGITELVVEGEKAVLNGRSIGTVDGEELDFPNDYKETQTDLIDGNLYLTFTVLDWVAEEAGIPKGHTTTVMLTKVEE